MNRFRSTLSLALLIAFDAGAFLFLRAAGATEQWRVDWRHLWTWVTIAPQADAVIGLLRWAGLAGTAWIGVSTALYLLAAVTRLPRLMRAAGMFTIPGVRRLVEGSMAMGVLASATIGRVAPAMAADRTWVPNSPAAVAAVAAPAPDEAAYQAVAPSPTAAGALVTAPGDNYWVIAAEDLAQQRGVAVESITNEEIVPRWLEIIDVNRDSGGNPSGDANLIFPDAIQVLPATEGAVVDQAATPVAPVTPVEAAPAATSTPVEPAVTPVEASAPAAAVVAPAPAAPSIVVAGEEDTAPADDGALLDTAPPVETAAATAPTVPSAAPVLTSVQRTGSPVPFVAGGLLATGLAWELLRRRRKQARRRSPGEVVPVLTPALEAVETAVATAADPLGADFLATALRAIAGAVLAMDEGAELPVPLGALLSDDALDVILVSAVDPPRGQSVITAHGNRWRVARATDRAALEELAAGCPMPLPALVSLGRTAAGAQVLLDLEEAMMVAVTGDGAAELVVAAGLQLALPAWEGFASVILVGFDSPPDTSSARVAASLEEVVEELEDRGERAAAVVRAAGCGSTFEARIMADNAVDGEPDRPLIADTSQLVPVIVVCATPPPAHLVERLVGLVSTTQAVGVAVLVAGEVPGAPWQYRINGGSIRVEQLNVDVDDPVRVTQAQAGQLAAVLEAAEAEPEPGSIDLGQPVAPAGELPRLLVRVLGPVSIEGPRGPIVIKRSSKCAEALVALVMNRTKPVDKDKLVTFLWPRSDDARKSGATLDATMWHLRQAVGYEYVPDLKGGEYLYRITDAVVSDLELVRDAYRRSGALPEAAAVELLREALSYVVGTPFDHATKGYEWASQAARDAATLVGDAAHRLFELYLAAGDYENAWWATVQGCLAAPGNEQMYRDRGRLQKDRGDGVDAIRATLDEALSFAEDDDPQALDEATIALFRDLTDDAGERHRVSVG